MSSARKRQRATRVAAMIDGATQRAMLAQHHADCLGQMAEEIARRHDDIRAVLKLALDAMMEADKHFSETDEKCIALAHAIPKVIDALGPNA